MSKKRGVVFHIINEFDKLVLFSKFNYNNEVKGDMGRACSTNWGEEECV
jgi:hypothetical protein